MWSRATKYIRENPFAIFMPLFFAVVQYLGGGGKFTWEAGKKELMGVPYAVAVILFLAYPTFLLFRYSIRFLAFQSTARGFAAIALGLILTIGMIVPLIYYIPINPGAWMLTMGFLGGVIGSLEAKDWSLERKPVLRRG